MKHGVVVLSSVNGTFSAGETITGGTSGVTDVIQADTVGFPGVRNFELSAVKQIRYGRFITNIIQLILL